VLCVCVFVCVCVCVCVLICLLDCMSDICGCAVLMCVRVCACEARPTRCRVEPARVSSPQVDRTRCGLDKTPTLLQRVSEMSFRYFLATALALMAFLCRLCLRCLG